MRLFKILAILSLALVSGGVAAQEWPQRPVRFLRRLFCFSGSSGRVSQIPLRTKFEARAKRGPAEAC